MVDFEATTNEETMSNDEQKQRCGDEQIQHKQSDAGTEDKGREEYLYPIAP